MSTNEYEEMPIQKHEGDEPSRSSVAQDQQEFERRLDRAERRSFWRTAISVALLVAVGLAILFYSVQRARQQAEDALHQAQVSRLQTREFQAQLHDLEQSLTNSREAVQYVTQGINLYHAGNYSAAVKAYDAALQLDPKNPYILDLKGYSLFKLKDFANAVSALQSSVTFQPDYAWGYFDLARVYCAEKQFDLASQSIKSALKIRPELAGYMQKDGEFLRLCAPLRKTFDDQSSDASSTATFQSSGEIRASATASSIQSTIDKISKGQHQELPQPTQTQVGPGQKPQWSVKNGTPYPLNLYMAGPVTRMYPIAKGQSIIDVLPPGNYRVAVTSPVKTIIPLYIEIQLGTNRSSVLSIIMKSQ
jgi:cytochrome c-type biogenesis protein CcmH/NrfG